MDLEKTVVEGYRVWEGNKVLGAPFLLAACANAVAWAFALTAAALAYAVSGPLAALLAALFTWPLALLAGVYASTHFTVCGLLMADKAQSGGKPVFADSYHADRRMVLRLLAVNVAAGLVLTVVFGMLGMMSQLAGINLIYPASIIAGCALLFAPYLIVFSGRGWIESIESSVRMLKANPVKVVGLYSVVYFSGSIAGVLILPALVLLSAPMPLAAFAAGFGVNAIGAFAIFCAAFMISLFVIAMVAASTLIVIPITTQWTLKVFRQLEVSGNGP